MCDPPPISAADDTPPAPLKGGAKTRRNRAAVNKRQEGVCVAIYHFSAKLISRSRGRSATAAAAYRAGLNIADERTGERHAYARRSGVLDHAVLTPARAPAWAQESTTLWNAVEQFEKRKDAQLAREVIVALPHEFSLEQNRELLHAFVQEAFVARGMAAQVNIHAPDRAGDNRNVHAHILLTTRQITRDGFKTKKARSWNERDTLKTWREQWAGHMNRALERAGKAERVEAGSFKAQGIEDRKPTQHLGLAASQMERRGERTRIGDENRAAAAFNRLQARAKVIDLAIEREKRRSSTKPPEKDDSAAANRRRAALQDQHLDQRGELLRAQTLAALQVHERQDAANQTDVQALRTVLEAIRARQARGGLWYRLRHESHDREAAAKVERSLAAVERQRAAEMQRVEAKQRDEMQALERAQHRERAALETKIWQEQQERRRAAVEPSPYERILQEREVFKARERNEGRDRQQDFER